MTPTYAVIRVLLLVIRVAELILDKAAERRKAGNLEAIQAAIEQSKQARTEDEAKDALKKLKAAFKTKK